MSSLLSRLLLQTSRNKGLFHQIPKNVNTTLHHNSRRQFSISKLKNIRVDQLSVPQLFFAFFLGQLPIGLLVFLYRQYLNKTGLLEKHFNDEKYDFCTKFLAKYQILGEDCIKLLDEESQIYDLSVFSKGRMVGLQQDVVTLTRRLPEKKEQSNKEEILAAETQTIEDAKNDDGVEKSPEDRINAILKKNKISVHKLETSDVETTRLFLWLHNDNHQPTLLIIELLSFLNDFDSLPISSKIYDFVDPLRADLKYQNKNLTKTAISLVKNDESDKLFTYLEDKNWLTSKHFVRNVIKIESQEGFSKFVKSLNRDNVSSESNVECLEKILIYDQGPLFDEFLDGKKVFTSQEELKFVVEYCLENFEGAD